METEQAWQDLLKWFRSGTQISYKKGEILLRPEDRPRDIFLLESGIVKVYSLTKQGDENIRVFKRREDVFPLIWAMKPVRRNAYYEVLEDVVVFRRSRLELVEYVTNYQGIGLALLDKFTDMYMQYADRINNLQFRYARERIAYRLISLMKSYGVKDARGTTIDLPIRQIELADTTNVTRETASRELLRLKKRGVIAYKDTKYTILKPDLLRKEYS